MRVDYWWDVVDGDAHCALVGDAAFAVISDVGESIALGASVAIGSQVCGIGLVDYLAAAVLAEVAVGWSIDDLDAYNIAVVGGGIDRYWGALVGYDTIVVGDRLGGAEYFDVVVSEACALAQS